MANRRDRAYYESSIWCYTDKLSFLPGETIGFRVSSPEPAFACRISRVGAQEVVLWIRDDQVGALGIDLHSRIGQSVGDGRKARNHEGHEAGDPWNLFRQIRR